MATEERGRVSRKNGSEYHARERAGQERASGDGEMSGWHRSEAAEDAQEGTGAGLLAGLKAHSSKQSQAAG